MGHKIIVTGGCGFIGHHFIEHLIKNTDWNIIIFDKLTYASNGYDRLRDINVFDDKRIKIFNVDLVTGISDGVKQEVGRDVNYIVHMAAETHVDRSIEDPIPFVMSNVVGTMRMLEYAKYLNKVHSEIVTKADEFKCYGSAKPSLLEQFVYFSTDEVFGPAPRGKFYKEWDRYDSTNPYSASKAGGEELCLAYANTYKIPMLISHTMNVFGERQHPEKFIPKVIKCVLTGETLTIHANSTRTKAGSRCWIHARTVADALLFMLGGGPIKRDKINIVGPEMDNLELAKFIAKVIGKPLKYEMVDFHSSRPGHDLRYALDGNKLRGLGFKPQYNLKDSLRKTVEWLLSRPEWLGISNGE